MATFVLMLDLGWAHLNDKAVMCRLLTFRDYNMTLAAGSLIAGQVDYENGAVKYYGVFRGIPRHIKRAANRALVLNDAEEDRIRYQEDWTPSRLAYIPASVYSPEHPDNGSDNVVTIVAFTAEDAAKEAFRAGIRVKKGYGYSGPGVGDDYHGMIWERLMRYQKHQEETIAV